MSSNDLKKLSRKLDQMARAASSQSMASRMRTSRCPVHGRTPTNVRVSGNEVTGEFCCERARERAVQDVTASITAPWR